VDQFQDSKGDFQMKRILFTTVLLAVLVFSSFGTASAITDGYPDGNGHPYVGLMVAQDNTGKPLWRCSGTLIAPTVFLTAGHCTETPQSEKSGIWRFESGIRAT